MDSTVVSGWRIAGRVVTIFTMAVVVLVPAALAVPVVLVFRGRAGGSRFRARRVVRLLQLLGPTFVKFGQLAGTRRDAVGPAMCDELATLHDAVPPMSRRETERALRESFGDELDKLFDVVDRTPVASGSIACVYRAVRPGGQVVALKLKRPGVDGRMRADLDLMRRVVKFTERFPALGGAPMGDLVGYMNRAILGQLDFAREAAASIQLRTTLSDLPEIVIPELLPELTRPNCLAFEFLAGLDRATPDRLPDPVRLRLAGALLAAAHKMMFVEGFVHCDMHPGNVYLTEDEHVVILDAGYTVRLPERTSSLIGEYFICLAGRNGRRCGEIVLESAVGVPPDADTEGFITKVAVLVEQAADPATSFDMFEFGNSMFEIQKEYGFYGASDFAFPLMSLLVLEGTVSGLSPQADFREVGGLPHEQIH